MPKSKKYSLTYQASRVHTNPVSPLIICFVCKHSFAERQGVVGAAEKKTNGRDGKHLLQQQSGFTHYKAYMTRAR